MYEKGTQNEHYFSYKNCVSEVREKRVAFGLNTNRLSAVTVKLIYGTYQTTPSSLLGLLIQNDEFESTVYDE